VPSPRCTVTALYHDVVDERTPAGASLDGGRRMGSPTGMSMSIGITSLTLPEPTDSDERFRLHDLWRVWVTPSDRKRCTYVTRDEQPPGPADRDNRIVRF
jgi:hypothetical protein